MNSKSDKSIRPLVVLQPFSAAGDSVEARGHEAPQKQLDIPAKTSGKSRRNCECDCHDSSTASSSQTESTLQAENVTIATEEPSADPLKIRIEKPRDADGPVIHKPVTLNVKISKTFLQTRFGGAQDSSW